MGINIDLFISDNWIQKFFDSKRATNKDVLSVQHSVVESFNFNDKYVRSVYVKDVAQCLVSKDVYGTIGYEKEDEVKAIQPMEKRPLQRQEKKLKRLHGLKKHQSHLNLLTKARKKKKGCPRTIRGKNTPSFARGERRSSKFF